MIAAMAVPAMASEKLPEKSEGFAFHCNAFSGNGKTYIIGEAKDYGKFDKKTGEGLIQLLPTADPKVWLPVVPDGKEWVCENCGSESWVSYSNKSGVPDGKNIQLTHVGATVTIEKEWILQNAHISGYYAGVVFFADFKVEMGIASKTLKVSNLTGANSKVSFFIPADLSAKIAEVKCTKGFILDETIYEDVIGGDKVTFVNEDIKYITEDAIRYYAICQIWNDLVWGFDGYGLGYMEGFEGPYDLSILPAGWVGDKSELNLTYGLFPVGVDHRTELMLWWKTDDKNVRYVPFGNTYNEDGYEFKWDEWADFILYSDINKAGDDLGISLQEVCDLLGIDVEAFIEAYDTYGFIDRNNLWE